MLDSAAKESLNRVSFSFWRNAGSDWISPMDAGRELVERIALVSGLDLIKRGTSPPSVTVFCP